MTHGTRDAIVVGADGGVSDGAALRWAAAVATWTGRPLVVLHSAEGPLSVPGAPASLPADLVALLDDSRLLVQRVDTAGEQLAEQGVQVRVEHRTGSPVGALLDQQESAWMLVVGTGGKGAVAGMFLGSTSLGVAAHAHRPVAVVSPGVTVPAQPHGRVAVAIDGGPDSRAAATAAIDLAAGLGAQVIGVMTWHVEVIAGYVVTERDSAAWAQVERDRQQTLDRVLLEPAAARGVPATSTIRRGPVVPTLLEVAAGCDALVVGSRGHGPVRGRLLGSVSQRLMRAAPCPVVVARG